MKTLAGSRCPLAAYIVLLLLTGVKVKRLRGRRSFRVTGDTATKWDALMRHKVPPCERGEHPTIDDLRFIGAIGGSDERACSRVRAVVSRTPWMIDRVPGIAACTSTIKSGRLSGHNLAVEFSNRGNQICEHRE